ncbi:transcription antitermination factor NusB [Thiohalocapsa marina]|uniref:Transcription antitermination protein NusB n=1 Tax=Thiohalocapsa marina TaxID=424902 RepID=A0A5M8FVI1_9GAMM|nr:transcription antitermination factor NusB [Thiohalocapsa marina]KAA6187838.1 transcription antitermination factor NusB [Thiohalocapsa marina]
MSGSRSEARRYAVLALYQWQVSGQAPAEIGRQFFDDPAWIEAVAEGLIEDATLDARRRKGRAGYDAQLFDRLLCGVSEHADEIDDALRPLLDRALKSIDPVERAILRVGAYELLFSPELPVAVVINEAVNLAKVFGAEQGHRYVNGVLDKLARQVRREELAARR